MVCFIFRVTEKPYVSLTPLKPRGLKPTVELMEGATLELRVEVDAYPTIHAGRWNTPRATNTSTYAETLSTIHRRFSRIFWTFTRNHLFQLYNNPKIHFTMSAYRRENRRIRKHTGGQTGRIIERQVDRNCVLYGCECFISVYTVVLMFLPVWQLQASRFTVHKENQSRRERLVQL